MTSESLCAMRAAASLPSTVICVVCSVIASPSPHLDERAGDRPPPSASRRVFVSSGELPGWFLRPLEQPTGLPGGPQGRKNHPVQADVPGVPPGEDQQD